MIFPVFQLLSTKHNYCVSVKKKEEEKNEKKNENEDEKVENGFPRGLRY